MVLNTQTYLEQYGWSPNTGLGKNSQGSINTIKLYKKNNTTGIGENSLAVWQQELSRYSNVYEKSLDNINIVTYNTDSDSDTDSHSHKHKKNKKHKSHKHSDTDTTTQHTKKHYIKLGFGVNALGSAANSTIEQSNNKQQYMGFVRASQPLLQPTQLIDTTTTTTTELKHVNDSKHNIQSVTTTQLTATTNNTLTATTIAPSQSQFGTDRQHLYHDRMPGKLRRLYLQELALQQESTSNIDTTTVKIEPVTEQLNDAKLIVTETIAATSDIVVGTDMKKSKKQKHKKDKKADKKSKRHKKHKS